MMSKLIVGLLILVAFVTGCKDDDSIVETPIILGSSEITLSGSSIGALDAEVGMLNSGDNVIITLKEKDGNKTILMNSINTQTGSYSIPDDFEVSFTDPDANMIYEINNGSVTIDDIGTTSVSGSMIGSGFPMDLTTFMIDSTKTLNISASFSL